MIFYQKRKKILMKTVWNDSDHEYKDSNLSLKVGR